MKNQMITTKELEMLIVEFHGELDNTNTFRYKEKLADTIDKHLEISRLILDFSRVSFIDSSGLGLILGRYNQMKLRLGVVEICGASPYIKKLFKMSGMANLFTFYENVEKAKGVFSL